MPRDYSEELDRGIRGWEHAREYGGAKKATLKFFEQETLDGFFESVKEEMAGELIEGMTPAEARASLHDYFTRGLVHYNKLYRAREKWAARVFERLMERKKH